MSETVSVIIPVYNVADYLPQCLDSIINQTYSNLQIILVDDGSSDGSGEICEVYAIKDKRITVVHQNNQGVSSARNSGLGAALGKYVVFVDGDDYLPFDSIEKRINSMDDNIDLVMGRIQKVTESGEIIQISQAEKSEFVCKTFFLKELFNEEELRYHGYLVDKLFNRNIIVESNLLFDTKVKINEDRLFIFQYGICCNKIRYIGDVLYSYRQRLESAMYIIKDTVTESEMSAIGSFYKMRLLAKEESPDLYALVCVRSFECSLALLRRSEVQKNSFRGILVQTLREDLKYCLDNRSISFEKKMKLILHFMLRR